MQTLKQETNVTACFAAKQTNCEGKQNPNIIVKEHINANNLFENLVKINWRTAVPSLHDPRFLANRPITYILKNKFNIIEDIGAAPNRIF